MKVCPQCRAEHEDYMSFCMQDGTPLTDAGSPTETPTESFGYEDDSASGSTGSQPEEIPRVMPTDMQTEQYSAESLPQTQQYSTEPQTGEYEEETVVRPTAHDAGSTIGQSHTPSANRQEIRSQPTKKSNLGIILGVLALGGLLLFGAVIGGGLWWYFNAGSDNEIAAANANQNDNSTSNINENGDNSSNENSSDLFGDNSETNENSNKNETPTPTKTPTPTPTKTPTPTPTKTPTPTPDDEENPTPDDKKTPTPDDKKTPTPPPPTPPPAPKTIAGGVVNGKARSLPKPAYPAAARAVGAKGAVNVQVLIDERGNVISASAISGHALLRSAAEQAARRAKFVPTQLSGQPVKVSGVITYVFN